MYAVNPRDQAQIIGTVIDGRYEIMQCVGEGGMGVVYKARQKSIDRLVAIKMLSSTLAKDKSWVQRFYNEAKACSRLHHPNTTPTWVAKSSAIISLATPKSSTFT